MMARTGGDGTGPTVSSIKSFAPLGAILPSFNGELGPKIRTYFEQLEEIADFYQWDADEQLRVAWCKLTGIAREFAYRNHKIKRIIDYDDFKKLMIERFNTELLMVRIQKFHQCMQQKDEDVQTYTVRLQSLAEGMTLIPDMVDEDKREIAENCLQQELDTKLKNQFVSGLSSSIRRQVMSEDPDTFEEAMAIAAKEEMIEKLNARPRHYISAADIEISELREEGTQRTD